MARDLGSRITEVRILLSRPFLRVVTCLEQERSTKKHEGDDRAKSASGNFVDRFPPAESEINPRHHLSSIVLGAHVPLAATMPCKHCEAGSTPSGSTRHFR